MPIKHLPFSLRPREKSIRVGVKNLNDIELLAIFLRSGVSNRDVLDIAKTIWAKYPNYQTLKSLSINQWRQFTGIGLIKAVELKALFELAIRINLKENQLQIKTTLDAVNFARQIVASNHQEQFLVLIVDGQNKIIYYEIMYKGTHSFVSIEPSKIIGLVLSFNAKRFYCFHNHPSGNSKPSFADKIITNKIIHCANLFNLQMLGHIIICIDGSYSKIL